MKFLLKFEFHAEGTSLSNTLSEAASRAIIVKLPLCALSSIYSIHIDLSVSKFTKEGGLIHNRQKQITRIDFENFLWSSDLMICCAGLQ